MAVCGGLTNNCKKKRSKRQRRKEKYTYLNAEFQRIARRDEKVFLSDQCKRNSGKKYSGKDQRSLQEEIPRPFHAKIRTIDRNGINLTEAEDPKKRLQEYTE